MIINSELPPIVDGIASFVVSGFILHTAYEIVKGASSILVDSKAVDKEKIEKIVHLELYKENDVDDTH